MDQSQSSRIREVFEDVLAHAPEARREYLSQRAQDDAELRSEVERLLAEHDSLESFLTTGVSEAFISHTFSQAHNLPKVHPQTLIGAYRVLRELGRGGMGVVYLAVRQDGRYHRHLALKILSRHLNTSSLVLRFEQEWRSLAALDHPNIVRIFDAGIADDLPYYVMDYVEGLPLNQYCEQLQIPLADLIQLFQQICRGAGYLHQHLMIHGDLKPSNLLVTQDGVVKLLDFASARKFDSTVVGAVGMGTVTEMLTPAYASPEQLTGAIGLGPQSDVYSFGTTLYELLTGYGPYETVEGKTADIVVAKVPPAPSKRIREHLRSNSKVSVRQLHELDNIVLKALSTDPRERYSSMADLDRDLQRVVDGLSSAWFSPGVWLKKLFGERPQHTRRNRGADFLRRTPGGTSDPEVALVRRATDIIGPERIASWMQLPVPSLNGRTPYSLMNSEQGRKEVEKVLGRIEHGVY